MKARVICMFGYALRSLKATCDLGGSKHKALNTHTGEDVRASCRRNMKFEPITATRNGGSEMTEHLIYMHA
jgi:hypothetical protein